jgi:glutamyl-tRNA reductase
MASRVGGEVVPFGELATALETVDVLLTSTGSPSVIVDIDDVSAVLEARAGRPLLIVDVAVPRDVDPAAGDLEGVTLLDMDDLRTFAEAGLAGRRAEIANAQEVLADEVEGYLFAASAREVAPLIAALRARADDIREHEIGRYQARLSGLTAEQREAVEGLTRGLINKLLHEPTVRLKDAAGSARADRLADAVRSLFDLP